MLPLIPGFPLKAAQARVMWDGGHRFPNTPGEIREGPMCHPLPPHRCFTPAVGRLPFNVSTESIRLLKNPLFVSQTHPIFSSFPPKSNYLTSSLRLQDVQLLPGNNALFLAHQSKKWQIDKNYPSSSKATGLVKLTFFWLENKFLSLQSR